MEKDAILGFTIFLEKEAPRAGLLVPGYSIKVRVTRLPRKILIALKQGSFHIFLKIIRSLGVD